MRDGVCRRSFSVGKRILMSKLGAPAKSPDRRRGLTLLVMAVAGAAVGFGSGSLTGSSVRTSEMHRVSPASATGFPLAAAENPTPSGEATVGDTSLTPSSTGSSAPIATTVGTATTLKPDVTTSTEVAAPRLDAGLQGAVVVVDPGHNGANGSHPKEISRLVDAGGFRKACNTTGTAAGSYSEAQFNWETSIRLANLLRDRGATVILTREDNSGWGPCVDQRGLTALSNRADLMISIHADGSSDGNSGFHVIRSGPVAGYVDQEIADRSSELATAVRDELVASGRFPSNYIGSSGLDRRNDLGTLNRAGVPAIMLESGNMHNASDLAMLRSAEGQQSIATALANGAERYLRG